MGKRKGLEHSAQKRAQNILDKKKESSKGSGSAANEDPVYDDVDLFHQQREKLLLDGSRHLENEEDEDAEFGSDVEGVMDLEGMEKYDSDESEGLEESEEEGDEEEEEEEDSRSKAWGTSKKNFYNTDYIDELDSDIEAAEEEEKEVERLQAKHAEMLDEEDLGLTESLREQEGKISIASADSKGLEEMNKELDSIDISGLRTGTENSVEKIKKDLSKFSRQEKLDIIVKDSPELMDLLDEFKESMRVLTEQVEPVLRKFKKGEVETSQGVSFLEVKFHLLLSYCTNISFYLLLKAKGRSVKDHPVIKQLVYLRTTIERLRPLDNKLKYQIDKLVKAAVTVDMPDSSKGAADPLSFKANVGNFAMDEEEKIEGLETKSAKETDSSGVYVAPKFAPVHYEEEETIASKAKKDEKRKKKNLKSAMMQELRDEYSDKPRELKDHLVEEEISDAEEAAHRRRYEEDNFIRLADKKGKQKKRKMVMNELDGLTDFGDFHHVDESKSAGDADSILKKKSFMQHIRKMEQSENKRSRLHQGGDEDLPYKGERNTRASRNTNLEEDHFGGFNDKTSLVEGEEDEYYTQVKNAKLQKKTNREELYKHTDTYMEEEDAEGKRGVTSKIEKNRGLTPKRKKETKNPRVKHKLKYQKAVIRRKGAVREAVDKKQAYGGEATGIKSNVSRSVRMH